MKAATNRLTCSTNPLKTPWHRMRRVIPIPHSILHRVPRIPTFALSWGRDPPFRQSPRHISHRNLPSRITRSSTKPGFKSPCHHAREHPFDPLLLPDQFLAFYDYSNTHSYTQKTIRRLTGSQIPALKSRSDFRPLVPRHAPLLILARLTLDFARPLLPAFQSPSSSVPCVSPVRLSCNATSIAFA